VFGNLPLLLGIFVITVGQILFVQVPFFSDLMSTVPLSGLEWTIAILSGTAVFWVQELMKTS
jgi:magnesium-transporting ATPase (P-type)